MMVLSGEDEERITVATAALPWRQQHCHGDSSIKPAVRS